MLGIVSLVLPVLPGWLFIGIGLYVLSLDSPGMQGRIRALRVKYRRVDSVMKEVERRMGHTPVDAHASEKPQVTRDVTTPQSEV